MENKRDGKGGQIRKIACGDKRGKNSGVLVAAAQDKNLVGAIPCNELRITCLANRLPVPPIEVSLLTTKAKYFSGFTDGDIY